MKGYTDLADLPEDERIRLIGECVMNTKQTIGFFVDHEEGKAERYVKKLQEQFPGIKVLGIHKQLITQSADFVKVGPPDA